MPNIYVKGYFVQKSLSAYTDTHTHKSDRVLYLDHR